jgi:hypothetical protein
MNSLAPNDLIKAIASGQRKAQAGDGALVREHISKAPFNRETRLERVWATIGDSVSGCPHPTGIRDSKRKTERETLHQALSSGVYRFARLRDSFQPHGTLEALLERRGGTKQENGAKGRAPSREVAVSGTDGRAEGTSSITGQTRPQAEPASATRRCLSQRAAGWAERWQAGGAVAAGGDGRAG